MGYGAPRFGYDQGVIANLLVMADFKEHFPVTPFQQGALSEYSFRCPSLYYAHLRVAAAILELGALVGALTCGTYGDSTSRRKAISLACGEDFRKHSYSQHPYRLRSRLLRWVCYPNGCEHAESTWAGPFYWRYRYRESEVHKASGV